MRNIIVSSAFASAVMVLPALASAVGLTDTLLVVSSLLNMAIGLFVTLAIVVFFWGLIRYLTAVGDDKGAGLQIMFWGVIAIFVMVSIWGIIRLLQATFKVSSTDPILPRGIEYRPGIY